MVGFLRKTGNAAGGFFDRIATLGENPSFALGIGLLSGNPNAGFAAAQNLRAEQLRKRLAQQEIGKQDAVAAQQRFENQLELDKLDLRKREVEKSPASFRNAMLGARFLYPDDPAKQRAFVEKSLTANKGTSVTVNTGDNAPTAPPVRVPERTPRVPDIDVIDKGTGPLDAASGFFTRFPALAPLTGKGGTDARRANKVLESIENDVRRAFAVNEGSRLSNVDINLAGKLVPARGAFSSESALIADMTELLQQIDLDIMENKEASRTADLTPGDRSGIQIAINNLTSAANKIDGVLASRLLAVQEVNGTPVGELTLEDLDSIDPSTIEDMETLRAIAIQESLLEADG